MAEKTFTITANGRDIECRSGQSIAAALIASGTPVWSATRSGARRGVFCGIGVCYDCLVELNGVPSVRACQAAAEPGDTVRWQEVTSGERG
jgi:predicted molibdopterin-dependent oxidoreductase YjgC